MGVINKFKTLMGGIRNLDRLNKINLYLIPFIIVFDIFIGPIYALPLHLIQLTSSIIVIATAKIDIMYSRYIFELRHSRCYISIYTVDDSSKLPDILSKLAFTEIKYPKLLLLMRLRLWIG